MVLFFDHKHLPKMLGSPEPFAHLPKVACTLRAFLVLLACGHLLSGKPSYADPDELGLDPSICRPAAHPERVTEYLVCETPIGTQLTYEELLLRVNRHLDWLEARGYPDGLTALNQGDRSPVLNLCNIDLTGGDFERALRDSVREPFNRPVIAGAYMPGAILQGVDLRIVDLRASYLHCIDFRGANLSAADLSMSNIDGSDFSGAILRDTALDASNMQGVDLHSAVFEPSSLMSPSFLNDLKGLETLRLDHTDLSEARMLKQLLDEAGHPQSADHVRYAIESAITRGLLSQDTSLFEKAWGVTRAATLGYLLEYGLDARRAYWGVLATILASTFFFFLKIRNQSAGRSKKEVFISYPRGEPTRNTYGEFEARSSDELKPVEAQGTKALVDALLISLVSALRIAVGPINLAATVSDFRPVKLSYTLVGRSRFVAGLTSFFVPALFALSFYY